MERINIITRIIEVEQEARRVAEAARERRAHLDEDLSAEKKALRDSIFERADKRLALIFERESAVADETIAAIEQQLAEELEVVEVCRRERHGQWVDALFNEIINL